MLKQIYRKKLSILTDKDKLNKEIIDTVSKRTNFIHCMVVKYKSVIFNWSLFQTTIIFILFYILDPRQNGSKTFFIKRSWDLFPISISAIGIILAAISVIVAVYSKDDMEKIVSHDKKTFEGFLFPYRYCAFLWSIICIISIAKEMNIISINSHFFVIISNIWLFLVIYSILYFLFLIKEIMENILLSSFINTIRNDKSKKR